MKLCILSTLILLHKVVADLKQFKMLIPAGSTHCVFLQSNEKFQSDIETKVYGKSPGIPGPVEIGLKIKYGDQESIIFLEEYQAYTFSIGNGSIEHELCYDNQGSSLVAKKVYLSIFSHEKTIVILPEAKNETEKELVDVLENIGEHLEQAERILDQTRMSHFRLVFSKLKRVI